MVKNKIKLTRTTTITPASSFVKRITVEGKNYVSVELQNKRVYHYLVTPAITKEILKRAKNKQSMGNAFNELLRGDSVAKTLTV